MNEFASGAKWWKCGCGRANSQGLGRCGGCGTSRIVASASGTLKPPSGGAPAADAGAVAGRRRAAANPKPRMNGTETAFSLILEAMKRRGDIVEYRPFGIRMEWGKHPDTGKPQIYSPDFYVVTRRDVPLAKLEGPGLTGNEDAMGAGNLRTTTLIHIKIVEVKRRNIWPADLIRFRGCRAEWPMFSFEMWQRDNASSPFNRIE